MRKLEIEPKRGNIIGQAITTLKIGRAAIEFMLEIQGRGNIDLDIPPADTFRKALLILSTLKKPTELKSWVKALSSVNHGKWIFDQAFPISENPMKYTSTPLEVNLSEQPVQVLGWAETKELEKKGVDQGLDGDWIQWGFENRADERGIDLEWHFHEHLSVSNTNHSRQNFSHPALE